MQTIGMKIKVSFLSFILLFCSALSFAQDAELIGSQAFVRECATCHLPASELSLEDARIPSLEVLQGLSANAIFTALANGKMSVQGELLSDVERIAVAEFLSEQSVNVLANNSFVPSQCSSTPDIANSINRSAWNGWGGDISNSRYQSTQAAGLSAEQIPNLELAWAFGFVDALAARTQPTVVGSWLFTAGGNGDIFALDAVTGCTHWVFKASTAVRTAMTLVASTDAYTLYFGDGQANAYALNAQTGELVWTRKVDNHPNATITGAPTVFEGRVYVPVSAAGEEVRGPDANYACCTFRGSVSALDATTGALLWKTYSIADEPQPRGLSDNGVQLFGPAGAGIWNAPTIDADRGLLYVGTGNSFSDPAQPTSDAILAMDLETGAIHWVSQTTPNDVWLWQCDTYNAESANCPENQGPDFDFSSSPILLTTPAGRELLVVTQKSGMVYAMDPDEQGSVVWEYRIGEGSPLGGQWGAASDGQNLYIGVADTLGAVPGGVHAIDLESGQQSWYAQPRPKLCAGAEAEFCFAAQGGPVSATSDAVFSGGSDGGIRVYASADGSLLWEYNTNRSFETVNGVVAKGATMDASGPVIVNGMLFINSGYNGIVGRAGNVLLAFRISE